MDYIIVNTAIKNKINNFLSKDGSMKIVCIQLNTGSFAIDPETKQRLIDEFLSGADKTSVQNLSISTNKALAIATKYKITI